MYPLEPIAIFTTFGTDGHINPFVAIAHELVRRGRQVCVMTHHPYVERYAYTGVPMLSLDSSDEFEALEANIELLNRPNNTFEFFDRFVFPLAEREAETIIHLSSRRSCVLVSADAPGIGARLAAEATASKFVVVFTAPGFVLSRPLYVAMLQLRFEDRIAKLRQKLGRVTPLDITQWINMSSKQIALWPEWYWSATSAIALDNAGFTWCESPAFDKTLSSAKNLRIDAVITGGSSSIATRRFFEVAVDGCFEGGFSARVVTRHERVLPVLPSRIERVAWEPDVMSTLSSAKIVIHHGGMGTTGRCLALGLPQLIVAAGGDRPENGRCVEELGVGRHIPLKQANSATVARLVNDLVMSAEVQKRARELALRCQAQGEILAADHIDSIMKSL